MLSRGNLLATFFHPTFKKKVQSRPKGAKVLEKGHLKIYAKMIPNKERNICQEASKKMPQIDTKIIKFLFVGVGLFFENHVFVFRNYTVFDEWKSPSSKEQ